MIEIQIFSYVESYIELIANLNMVYQENTVGKQSTNEFFGMCTTQELEFMPLALFLDLW